MKFHVIVSLIFSLWCLTVVKGASDACNVEFTYPVDPSADEDGKLNMTQLVTKYGYPIETHTVTTSDGYILTLYRIPYGRKCGPSENTKAPVLVQHGMLSSSYDYLILGPRKSLGYLLADNCYDVWLGNNRGNSESRNHVSLNPNQKEYWEFSWHEMGLYDLPAMIDYILSTTGQPSTHYIGHSQGTTQFFVFGAVLPEYQKKIRSMHALSPVAFMKDLKSPLATLLNRFQPVLEFLLKVMNMNDLFANNNFLNLIGSEVCKNTYPELQGVCCNVLFLLCGFDEPQINKTILPAIIGHTPAGSSVKQLFHYSQGIGKEHFRQFDYGAEKNKKIYGVKLPPNYDVSKIKTPVALYYGKNDYLASLNDVKKLEKLLPNVVENYYIPYSKFNHLDFIFATDIKILLYERLLEVLKKF